MPEWEIRTRLYPLPIAMSLNFSNDQLQKDKEAGTGVLGLVLNLLRVVEGGPPITPFPLRPVVHLLNARGVFSHNPSSLSSYASRLKLWLGVSFQPNYHSAFLRLCMPVTAVLPLDFLGANSSRQQDPGCSCLCQSGDGSKGQTEHSFSYPWLILVKIPVTFVQGILHLLFTKKCSWGTT